MATNDPDKLEATASLPSARKGYDRAATDELVGKLRSSLASAQARVVELEQQLVDNSSREKEIADALVVAARVRAESEREAEEIKTQAWAEAAAIVEDARAKTRGFEQEAREAEELAERARAKLTAFLQSLLAKLGQQGSGLDSPVDDLLTRATEAADHAGREPADDRPA